jgi:glycosyltransferase involved in cell wall biosynthesis
VKHYGKPRICIITPVLEDGIGMSVAYRALLLAPECCIRIGVLRLQGERNRRRLEQAGVQVYDLKGRRGVDPISPWRALHWASRQKIDLVQVEQAAGYPHAWLVSRVLRKPLVVWLNTPNSPFEGVYRKRLVSRFLFLRADHIVCNSHYTRSRLLSHYPSVKDCSSVLYYPIDPIRFRPSLPRPARRVGVVATMIEVKSIDRLLRAWPLVHRQHPDASLDIYGDGPMRSVWIELATDLDLGPEVHFHGFVDDVPAAMNQIGIFVLPTEGEAFGQVFVEAMLMERPCIAVRSGGVPEVVLDGETGLLVSPGKDPEPLAEAITRLLEEPGLGKAMGEAGRRRALECFVASGDKRTEYIERYHEILSAGR